MFTTFSYAILVAGGYLTYIAIGGKEKKIVPCKPKDEKNYEQMTYDYFMTLSFEDQYRYFSENLDLNYYKSDLTVGFTNDRHLNAKHASEIARRVGKCFINKYKTY